MSFDQLQQSLKSLTKLAEDNQKLSTPILAAKLSKYSKAYPEDQTLGAINLVVKKMLDNKTFFIRRAEFQDLYRRLHSRNTRFTDFFGTELGQTEKVEAPKVAQEVKPLKEYKGDEVLANALTSLFEAGPIKMYSAEVAKKAQTSVMNTLDAWNLRPNKLSIDAGNEKFLMIKADYESPKGITSFYVPIETRGNKVLAASVFLGNVGPEELNHVNIKNYLTNNAGLKLKANGEVILQALTVAATENREISDAELALIRLKSSRQAPELASPQILGQKMVTASVKEVEGPKSDEFKSFEQTFTSPFGAASFQFGNNVTIARDNIVRQLVSFGHKNPQVVVANSDKQTVSYAVSLDGKVAFTVPVKMANGKINGPFLMLCNGTASSFNKENIANLYLNNQTDFKVAAVASPLFGSKPSELINEIRQSVAEENHAKAEDALNVLANTGDEKAYAVGFQIYLQGLGGKKEAEKSKCSMVVKNSSSEHPLCGHTGLPLHKVYQDKHGNCSPLYRRGMAESYEGASFLNAKIFG